jgi:hyperosmotically inducible periplasmic protein
MRRKYFSAATFLIFLASAPVFHAQGQDRAVSPKAAERITREVRHELVMLPYYSVFDNLAYKVSGYTVTLVGQVTKPTLKSNAEKAVKSIEGVQNVVNNIEVLPLSAMDDQLRRAVYRAVYGQSGMEIYSLQAVPPFISS